MLQGNPENYQSPKDSENIAMPPTVPLGLEALYNACRSLYPSQPNPLQVTALVKYWLGGPDPLDYISMYHNSGSVERNIPAHWHYVSFGLSDLHGDGRVHEPVEINETSGCGFELTMRVKCQNNEISPPTWPAALMQALAGYVFKTEANFCSGDHVSWHTTLDNSVSGMQNMLIVEDPQLPLQQTPFGKVNFMQIVGILHDELQAIQQWNGIGVQNIMRRCAESGGEFLVTDMSRKRSIFHIDSNVAAEVEAGIELEGSNLSGASAKLDWGTYDCEPEDTHCIADEPIDEPAIKSTNLPFGTWRDSSVSDSVAMDNVSAQTLQSLHLVLNLEAGLLLPLVLRGRLKHGRHFTFKSLVNNFAVTLLTPAVDGAFVSEETPYAVRGAWLQVLVTCSLLEKMLLDLSAFCSSQGIALPSSFEWAAQKLKITIVAN